MMRRARSQCAVVARLSARERAKGRLVLALSAVFVLAVGASAQVPRAARCSARQQAWFDSAPAPTLEFVYGVGSGPAYAAALAQSRVRAAEAFGIEVRSLTTDRQVLERSGEATREASSFEILEETRVKRVLEGCQVLESCTDSESAVRVLTRCSRKSQEEREAEERAALGRLAACDASKPWSSQPRPMTAEHIFGVGWGRSLGASEAAAKVRAAETLGVEVRAKTSDRQVLWQKNGVSQESSEFEQVADTVVARRLEGCTLLDQCREGAGAAANVATLVQCFRRSGFERSVEQMGASIAGKLPKEARLLLVPGTDSDGAITGLGELGTSVLRAAVDAGLPAGTAFVRTPAWQPAALHEVARHVGATHLLRFEYTRQGDRQVRLDVWAQRAENDVTVPGTAATATVDLDDAALSLLDAKGPLLPQKDALSLAGELAPRRLAVGMPPKLKEGAEVEFAIEPEKSGYLYVFSIDERGAVTMLRPVAAAPDARVEPGKLRFPEPAFRRAVGGGIVACGVKAQARTRENVKTVLTSKPLDLPAWGPSEPVLEFSQAGAHTTASLLESLNKLKRVGAILADATTPYLIESTGTVRGICP